MSQGVDWVSPEEATWLVHLCWLAVVIVVAAWRSEVPSRKWKTRAKAAEADNRALRLTLGNPRRQPGARRAPLELHDWPEPNHVARERHWTSTLWWPGTHGRTLPLSYGDHLDPARLGPDPSRPIPPTDDELALWLAEERVIDLLVDHLLMLDDTRELEALLDA